MAILTEWPVFYQELYAINYRLLKPKFLILRITCCFIKCVESNRHPISLRSFILTPINKNGDLFMEATSFNKANPAMYDSIGLTSPIEVDEEKFNHLTLKPVGDEKLKKASFKLDDGSQEKVEQKYFSGLVYRYDLRNISEIKKAGGFYPKVPRDKNHRLLAREVIPFTGLPDYSRVYSTNVPGVIATSRSMTETNNWGKARNRKYKYMIDTKMNNILGLNPDYFRNGQYPTFEVCFEDPLPYSCIVGYFENENFTKFYLNNEYQGNFSWSAENVVDHYQNHTPQNHSLVTKAVEIVEQSVWTFCTVQ